MAGEGSPVVNEWGRRFRDAAFELRVRSPLIGGGCGSRQLPGRTGQPQIERRGARGLAEAVRVTLPRFSDVVRADPGRVAEFSIGWIVLGARLRRGQPFVVQASAVRFRRRNGDGDTAAGVVPGPPPFADESGKHQADRRWRRCSGFIEEESLCRGRLGLTHPCTDRRAIRCPLLLTSSNLLSLAENESGLRIRKCDGCALPLGPREAQLPGAPFGGPICRQLRATCRYSNRLHKR